VMDPGQAPTYPSASCASEGSLASRARKCSAKAWVFLYSRIRSHPACRVVPRVLEVLLEANSANVVSTSGLALLDAARRQRRR
jgi:hypothetical protein